MKDVHRWMLQAGDYTQPSLPEQGGGCHSPSRRARSGGFPELGKTYLSEKILCFLQVTVDLPLWVVTGQTPAAMEEVRSWPWRSSEGNP